MQNEWIFWAPDAYQQKRWALKLNMKHRAQAAFERGDRLLFLAIFTFTAQRQRKEVHLNTSVAPCESTKTLKLVNSGTRPKDGSIFEAS